jgi:hypothetical protein
MFIKDGKRFNIFATITINDVLYPGGVLANNAELRQSLGITEIADPARASEETHFVQEIDDAPYVVNTPKPLAQIRAAIQAKVKVHRDTLQERGVKVGNYWIHNDVKSRTQWERMASKAQVLLSAGGTASDNYLIAGQPVPWKTMTGEYITLTLGFISQVVDAIELQEALIFSKGAQHDAAINAANTIEAIAGYNWKAGWPLTYEVAQA